MRRISALDRRLPFLLSISLTIALLFAFGVTGALAQEAEPDEPPRPVVVGTASGGQPTHGTAEAAQADAPAQTGDPAEAEDAGEDIGEEGSEESPEADPAADSGVESELGPDGEPLPVTRLRIPDELPDGSWVEVTPLVGDAPARLWLLDEWPGTDRSLDPGLPQGPVVVCAGAPGLGVTCMRTFLYRGDALRGPPSPEALARAVGFAEGTPITGRYLSDGLPVVGARVAVVPVDLPMALMGASPPSGSTGTLEGRGLDRPFTVPLQVGPLQVGPLQLGEPPKKEIPKKAWRPIVRTVETDEDGFFLLPPLVGGRYFLEATLPTGLVHRSEPFDLPIAAEVRAAFGPEGEVPTVWADLAWELGDIEIALGLALEIRVSDPFGQPIPGAQVQARQGQSADDLQTFRAETDADGQVVLVGFDVERSVQLDCLADGHTRVSFSWELVPVVADCVLEPFAEVFGSVRGIGGDVPTGTTLALRPQVGEDGTVENGAAEIGAAEIGAAGPELRSTVDAEGRFRLPDLPPGAYSLTVGAPGHEAWQTDFTLGPAERRDLGAITLLAGRPLEVRVVDAADGEPLPDARVHVIEPAGASRSVDADGEVVLAAPGEVPLVLEAESPEYAPNRVTVTVAQQEADEVVVIELKIGGWVRAVVGGDEMPCAGCRLLLTGRDLPPGGLPLLTDGAGEVLSRALVPGWYEVRLPETRHLGSMVVERPEAESRWARVEAGEIATVRFELERPSLKVVPEPRPEGRYFLVTRSGGRTQTAEPEADGSWQLSRRPGEELQLFLRWWDAQSGANIEVRQGVVPASFGDELFPLRLADGATLLGRLTVPSTGFDAAPAAGVRIRLREIHGSPLLDIPGGPLQGPGGWVAEARSRPDGSFEIRHLPPGVYIVMAGDRMLMPISLAARQTYDLRTFQLLPNGF